MALTKTVVDVMAADGLNQKFDPRRLPIGKSAKALNLVKNKQGRLEKRLGFKPLPNNWLLDGDAFTASRGIALGTRNQELYSIVRGNWVTLATTPTVLSTQSDDLLCPVRRGQMPEVKVTFDNILCDTLQTAICPTAVVSGDYMMTAWIDVVNSTAVPYKGDLYYTVIEVSTGNTVQPATRLVSGGSVSHVRLAAVGTNFVLCYSKYNFGQIFCQVTPIGVPSWNNYGPIINDSVLNQGFVPFDMRGSSDDPNNFVLAYQTLSGETPDAIVADRRASINPAPIAARFVVDPSPGSIPICAIGLTFDIFDSRCAVAYAKQTSLIYPVPATPFVIVAATCIYPSMGFINGASTNKAQIYQGTDVNETPPIWLDVAMADSSHLQYAIAHSPYAAVWNSIDETHTILSSQVGRIVGAQPVASRCARIIINEFRDGNTFVTPVSNVSNDKASNTPGYVLASRGIPFNGVIYYLGWIPSATQGGYITLSFDQAKDTSVSGMGYPMRPVANLQTRLALAEPGLGRLFGHQSLGTGAGANMWTGASEWTRQVSPLDLYSTSHVAYTSTTQGQRQQPARGALQLLPTTGFSSSQWGSLGAISGAVPTVFDGESVFEQGFLWTAESVVVIMGTPGVTPGPKWTSNLDAYNWIFTWEQFDAQGNYHLSARSNPVNVTYYASGAPPGQLTSANSYQPNFWIPTLSTLRQSLSNGSTISFGTNLSAPTYPVTLGVYRTTKNGLIYYRISDRYYDSLDTAGTLFAANRLDTQFVTYTDTSTDSTTGSTFDNIDDGTYPLLYGDGTNGLPGAIDNFCPPASNIMVRHKERLFVARGNQVMYTKQRGELAGPGYNEQINVFFVGDDQPIIAMETMDDKLVIFKPGQLYFVSGDGPGDDGSGNSFQSPQPIPTDAGCSDPNSVRGTPEGVYFMSSAGLRLLTRSLSVQYVGGPVEDELTANPLIASVVLYPQQNRVVFAASTDDTGAGTGEMLWRDYVLDAWTTAQVQDGVTLRSPVSLVVANAPVTFSSTQPGIFTQIPVLHFMTGLGQIWRERDPAVGNAFYDNNTYVGSSWITPQIKQQDQSRFRLWDIQLIGQSLSPHGLQIKVHIDYGPLSTNSVWTWNTVGGHNIAPGGTIPLPLTQLRTYDGRMGEAFQVEVVDVPDVVTGSGQGFQVLGLSLGLGTMPGLYKLPKGSTQ